jgi:hypothetical protein
MKKAIRIMIFGIGVLLIIVFFVTIAYDYYLINTRMFANPLGIQFTIILSAILFFFPAVICIIVAHILKRKK